MRTTPEAIDLQRLFREMLDVGDRSCAMEASSHASELHRLDRVRFSALVFTNLSQDHLDFHGDLESYFQAKRRLFLEGSPPAAVNVGDEHGRRLAAELPGALTFGFGGDAAVGPDALAGWDLKLRGRFNVENALGALAAGRLLGIADDAIRRGIESIRGVPGRFEAVDEGQHFSVIVDYAHKPGALENVLQAARDLADGNRVLVVVGAGGDRDRGKRPLMGRLASELADVAIVTSDNPRSEEPGAIIEEIVAGATRPVEIEPDRAAAIALALGQARPGDVVLIAGKGAEPGQQLADRTIPFDDREVAREVLRALGGGAVIPLPLDELRGLGLGRLDGDAAVVTGVQIDSRRVVPGDLFVALDGGAAFLEDARARGAAATLVPADGHAAMAALGRAVRDRSDARVVAITGSVGKTSTKDILAALVRPHRRVVAAEDGLQQRDRAAADALPHRAGHRGRRHRDGDARARPDPRAGPDGPPGARRDHLDRAGAPRAARLARERRAREGGAARGAARRCDRDPARRDPGARAVRAGRARRAPRRPAAGRDPRRPGARRVPRPRGRVLLRGAPPGRERGGRARDLCGARACRCRRSRSR